MNNSRHNLKMLMRFSLRIFITCIMYYILKCFCLCVCGGTRRRLISCPCFLQLLVLSYSLGCPMYFVGSVLDFSILNVVIYTTHVRMWSIDLEDVDVTDAFKSRVVSPTNTSICSCLDAYA
jgi:hypothetical protein